MATLTLSSGTISYHLRRERRRTISVRFRDSETLEVAAPYLTPDFVVTKFLEEKRPWIEKTVTKLQTLSSSGDQISFASGDYLPFFTTSYQLQIMPTNQTKRTRLYAINHTFQVLVPIDLDANRQRVEIKEAVHSWYLHHSKPVLEQRVNQYAELMNLRFGKIVVKDVSSQWGSCSVHGTLSFNYRIAMLPIELADYIIVHELSHLKEMNHSPRFWAIVASVIPEYKQLRQELRHRQIALA